MDLFSVAATSNKKHNHCNKNSKVLEKSALQVMNNTLVFGEVYDVTIKTIQCRKDQ